MVLDKIRKRSCGGRNRLCSYCENSLYFFHEGVFQYVNAINDSWLVKKDSDRYIGEDRAPIQI